MKMNGVGVTADLFLHSISFTIHQCPSMENKLCKQEDLRNMRRTEWYIPMRRGWKDNDLCSVNIDSVAETPLYIQAMDKLRSRIESGELKPGGRLPSERSLALEFNISKVTMNKALSALAREGLLERHVGRGTFVAYRDATQQHSAVKITVVGLQDTLEDEYYVGLHRGIQEVALNESLDVLYASVKDGDYSSLLNRRRSDGLLIIDPEVRHLPELQSLSQRGVPFVILGASLPDVELPCVDSDNYSASVKGVQYLHRLGHRRIGSVFVNPFQADTLERRRGFISGLAEYGLEFHQNWCIDDVADGKHMDDRHEEILKNMVLDPEGPTAFFCGGYHLAVDTVRIIRQLRLTVPGHISVLGFDGPTSTAYVHPALTTLRQPLQIMGFRAMQKLLAIAGGDSGANGKELFDMELIIQDSCAPPA